MLDPRQTVATLVLDHSEVAPIFQRHRIDFCCRGEQSIEAAASAKGIDTGALLDELARAIAERNGQGSTDPRALSTPALIAHIIGKHHTYLRKTLPFVQGLATKVGRVHGDRNPKLRELDLIVGALGDALLPHLDIEEQILFPVLMPGRPSEVASQGLASMLDDHRDVGALLERMWSVTDGYAAPDWACNSYRTLLSELAALERDVLEHVHLENHVLMPRFAV